MCVCSSFSSDAERFTGTYDQLLVSAVASGLLNFNSYVQGKYGESSSGILFDDLVSKLAAWKSASQVVKLFLHLGFQVITGLPGEKCDVHFENDVVGKL